MGAARPGRFATHINLIYVPTAPTVDWQKYLDLFRLAASPVGTAATLNAGFRP